MIQSSDSTQRAEDVLGPVDGWPPSLRTTLRTCLASPVPMLIWWGPELVALWNDAGRSLLDGAAQQASPGQPGRAAPPDLWPQIEGAVQAVWATGAATTVSAGLPGGPHTLALSPIYAEGDQVAGVLCIAAVADGVHEAERRARERAERLQALTVALGTATTPGEVYEAVLQHGFGMLGQRAERYTLSALSGTLYLLDGDTLRLVSSAGAQPALIARYQSLPLAAAIPAAEAVREARPIWFSSRADFIRQYPHLEAEIRLLNSEAAVSLPVVAEGQVLGGLNFTFARPLAFDADERGFLLTIATLVGQALERSRLFEAEREARRRQDEAIAVLQGVLDNLPVGLALFDRDLRFQQVNRRMAAINRRPPEAHIGRRMADLAAPGAAERRGIEAVEALLSEVFATGQGIYDREVSGPAADDLADIRHSLASWFPVLVDGEVRLVGASVLDITDRVRSEQAQRVSEERFRRVVESRPVGVLFADTAGRITHANAALLEMLGATAEWLLGKGWAELTPPEYAARDAEATAELLATDSVRPYEKEYFRADGSRLPVLVAATRLRTGDSFEAVGFILDNSERKRAAEALRESEERFRSLFESIDEGFCIVECLFDEADRPVDYRFLQANPAFERLTGLRGALGRTARELVPDLEPFWYETYGRVALTGEAVRFENGSASMGRWFDVYASRVGDATSRRVAIVFNNITERKEAEAERERLYAQEQAARIQAEEASRLKDEFLATVSHELRTPLTAFLGYAELLLRRKRDEAYVARTVEKMARSARTQAQLIEDLLDVSRIVSGKLRIEAQPIDLAGVIRAALDTVRPAAEAKELQLIVDLDPDAGEVVGDENRLQQVVWNLLSNATKFTPPGGAIRLSLARDGREALVTVSDTGRGIRADFLPFVFDRFRQADSTSDRSYSGLGLGLSIVRHLVELHGGSVAAASAGEQQGATFTVRLPLAGADGAVALPAPGFADDRPRDCPPELRGLRVLVVDDQPDILELVDDILSACEATVRSCATAREALATLRAWRPDVLVSDIAMPVEDGYWLIQQVRALPRDEGGATPALALTAYVRMEERLDLLASGFQLYVPKPVEASELRAVVARLAGSAGED